MIGATGADLGAALGFGAAAAELERVIAQGPAARIDFGGLSEGASGERAGRQPDAGGCPLDPVRRLKAEARLAQPRRAGRVGVGHPVEIRVTGCRVNGPNVTRQDDGLTPHRSPLTVRRPQWSADPAPRPRTS